MEYVPIFSVLISFASVALVVIQLRANAAQRDLESLKEILEINRELLTLGFTNPVLFDILNDTPGVDPVWEKRYLQMWLNQLSLTHSFQRRGIFRKELREAFERDIRDFMALTNMRCHWEGHKQYYSGSFRRYVEGILNSGEKE